MKKYILSLVMLFIFSCTTGAQSYKEKHFLDKIEESSNLYIQEILKADLQQLKDVEGKNFWVVKRNNPLDEAYDNLVYWLSFSLSTYEDKEKLIEDWRGCKSFMRVYVLFEFDGFCDKHFADFLSREEYLNITDYLFNNL